jgi:hypothetical protein
MTGTIYYLELIRGGQCFTRWVEEALKLYPTDVVREALMAGLLREIERYSGDSESPYIKGKLKEAELALAALTGGQLVYYNCFEIPPRVA